jgi:hypothetical protein
MATDAPTPTTPPQLRPTVPSAPAPTRQSNRTRTTSARAKATAEAEMDTVIIQNAKQNRAYTAGQQAGGENESAESRPDIYITMISSVLGPVVRKLEALDGHIEGLTNNFGTYDIRASAFEGQGENESLIREFGSTS